jgi:hypothetical protein
MIILRAIQKSALLGGITVVFALSACSQNPTSPSSATVNTQPQGGVDGGGGDFLQSTEYQVKSALDLVYYVHLADVFYNLALTNVEDPYVQRVKEKWFNDEVGHGDWKQTQPIFQSLRDTKFVVQDKGCQENSEGASHAMGVKHFKPNEEICVSLETLRKLPPADLQTQIIGLFSHEFAHHFGFGEMDALKFQTYVVHNLEELKGFGTDLRIKIPKLLLQEDQSDISNLTFTFQEGHVVSRNKIDSSKASCGIHVAAAPYYKKTYISDSNPNPVFLVPAQTLLLHYRSGSGSSADFQKKFSRAVVDGLDFIVNPKWTDDMYDIGGIPAYTPEGNEGGSMIYTISCSGEDLHQTDLKRVFGGVQ